MEEKRRIWENPWKYKEGFVIALFLIIIGFAIQYTSKNVTVININWPTNIIIILVFASVIITLATIFKSSNIVKWLGSIPASVSSISTFTILTLLMGFIVQDPSANPKFINKIGLSNLTHSWSFIIAQSYLLITLGLVVARRITPINLNNIGFTLNHLGLWIVISAGVLGTGDLQRLSMELQENQTSWIAKDSKGNEIEMPFAFKLNDFSMQEYNPKIGIVDNNTGKLLHNDGKNLFLIEPGLKCTILDYNIELDTFLQESGYVMGRFEHVNDVGASPSAFVKVTDTKTNNVITDWISCGSFRMPYKSIKIDSLYSVVMLPPEPKEFKSKVTYYTKDGDIENAELLVNHPINVDGWEIYQLSYDYNMGKWSSLSVIELVKDPWINIVYLGFYMMIAGAVFLFFRGKKLKTD